MHDVQKKSEKENLFTPYFYVLKAITNLNFYNLRECSGTPLQYSCLENPMGGGAWWAAVHWDHGHD